MKRTRKILNLIALVVFLGQNFLTPFSYAFADDIETSWTEGETQVDSSASISEWQENAQNDDSTSSRADSERNEEEGEGSSNDSETEMDSSSQAPQNDGDTQESHPTPLLLGEGSPDFIGTREVDSEMKENSSLDAQNDNQKDASLTKEGDHEVVEDLLTGWQDEIDNGTWETSAIEVIKDLIENLTWDAQALTWEILTWDIEELTWEVVELTWTALELSQARETLNTDPIEKSETYNKVAVNVLAPANTFPENTKLVIEAVKWNKLEEVKQQISDEPTNNIDEDAEIVAFDIRFEYELSDGSKVELQPKENTVQVTFDYSKNKELKKAEADDSQQIEIYHINDKDENGEKVAEWEEKVETIDINEQKSAKVENGLVIDAESFSYYTIVVQRREEAPESAPTQTWQYWEDKDYLTVYIQMMDRMKQDRERKYRSQDIHSELGSGKLSNYIWIKWLNK